MQPSFDNPDVGTSSVESGSSDGSPSGRNHPDASLANDSSTADSRLQAELPSSRFVWTLRILCVAGFSISLYLAYTAFSMGQVFGCSGGDVIDCGHVLTSHWSKVFGVPVSVPAAGLYATLISLLAFARSPGPRRLRQMVWGGMTLGSVSAGLAALWFIGLQIFVLKHYCPYCLVVHTCGIILAGTMLSSKLCIPGMKLQCAGASLLGIAALVGIQVVTPKADQFEIVHYDPVPVDSVTTDTDGMDVFAAPGDAFEPPGGVFEPPGEAFPAPGGVFEPPVTSGTTSAGVTAPTELKTGDSQQAKPKDKQPSVATTFLLIAPPRLLQLTELLFAMPSVEDDETPAAADTEKSEATENASSESNEEAKTSDTEKKDDSTESATNESKPAEEKPALVEPAVPARRLLTFAGNRFTLDVKQWPLLGKTDAKYVFVEMFDYTCPHCRNTHQAIAGAQKQYSEDLAIFVLPVPLENACNPAASGGGHPGACELARISIAVWRLDPSKFQTFHDWMFESSRSESAARQFAETLVDKERLKTELASGVPGQYIGRHVSLYQRVGSGQVPKLIFPSTTMQGEVNSVATLCQAIERELAVAKK
jgi:uncharacterized membrane protein/protein-disulfide isomerase